MSIYKINSLQKRLLDTYQRGLPLSSTPYADMAGELGVCEEDVISALEKLADAGVISRVGPVFRPGTIGVSTLAAMKVPKTRLEEVAALLSSYSEVNHNCEREHHFNLWFVVTAATEKRIQEILDDIEQNASLPLMSLPMQASYHIDLGFDLQWI